MAAVTLELLAMTLELLRSTLPAHGKITYTPPNHRHHQYHENSTSSSEARCIPLGLPPPDKKLKF